MKRLEIYKKIVEIEEKKKEHLKEYAARIKKLADSKDSSTFLMGDCTQCAAYDKEISELQELANNTLSI